MNNMSIKRLFAPMDDKIGFNYKPENAEERMKLPKVINGRI